MRSKIIFGVVSASCVGVMWLFAHLYRRLLEAYERSGTLTDLEYSWLFRLGLNLAGYATIMVPGFILYKYLQKSNYFDKISNKPPTWLSRTLFACFGPYTRLPTSAAPGAAPPRDELARRSAELALCFTGLMGAYLVWGLLQEKIMTQKYVLSDGSVVQFSDSALLVLGNRLGALLAALARLACSRRALLAAPLYQFSYCALTNVLSAWCQYEALKYVSFPTQVLSKSCKVIPVMLMGKLISRNKYAMHEYATAALISGGMVMFMLGSHTDYTVGAVGGVGGFALLALYLWCDSFTSTWQSALFRTYELHPLQMLAAVNLCSVALTAAALLHRDTPPHHAALLQHPGFISDCVVLSLSSAIGQLLIYRTIANFGAVVFAIIMTLRQAVSILLSCLVYGHRVSVSGGVGVTLVFLAVFLRVYCAHRLRERAARVAGTPPQPRTTRT